MASPPEAATATHATINPATSLPHIRPIEAGASLRAASYNRDISGNQAYVIALFRRIPIWPIPAAKK